MEFLVIIAFFGYIYYLKNYADLRTAAEKEEAALAEGINMYREGRTDEAFGYFDTKIKAKPKSSIAYLYRGLCFEDQGKMEMAAQDFQTALSYDGEVYQTHFETGRFYFHQNDYKNALIYLNKAVALGENSHPEAYHYRALTYAANGQTELANADFESEEQVTSALGKRGVAAQKPKSPFIDRRLIISMVMVIFTSALVVATIKTSEGVHMPYLVAVFSAISIGFAEPFKGWLLAILQCVLIFTGYQFFTELPESGGRQELENFGMYGAMILTFAASFLGSFLKKAFLMS